MKFFSSIDADDLLISIIRQARDTGEIDITGVICPEDDRPADSQTEDIVVNTIDLTQDNKPQDGTTNVNIYVPDIRVKIRGKEQTKADRQRLQEIGDALVSFIKELNHPELEIWIESDTILAEPTPRQHYRNIRVKLNIH